MVFGMGKPLWGIWRISLFSFHNLFDKYLFLSFEDLFVEHCFFSAKQCSAIIWAFYRSRVLDILTRFFVWNWTFWRLCLDKMTTFSGHSYDIFSSVGHFDDSIPCVCYSSDYQCFMNFYAVNPIKRLLNAAKVYQLNQLSSLRQWPLRYFIGKSPPCG